MFSFTAFASCIQITELRKNAEFIRSIRQVNNLFGHNVKIYSHAAKNQVVVLIGERHSKFSWQKKKVNQLLQQFSTLAVESTPETAPKKVSIKNDSSGINGGIRNFGAYAIDYSDRHFWNSPRPFLCALIGQILYLYTLTVHSAFPDLANQYDLQLSTEAINVWKQIDGYIIRSLPIVTWSAVGMLTDLVISFVTTGFMPSKIEWTRFLPFSRGLIYKRDKAMAAGILNVLDGNPGEKFGPAPEKLSEREAYLEAQGLPSNVIGVVVGGGHLPGIGQRLIQNGFQLEDILP